MKPTPWLVCILSASATLAAQRQPVAGDRSVQLYDVRDLLAAPALVMHEGKPDPFGIGTVRPESLGGDGAQQTLAELVRAFLPPPAAAAGDVAVVGGSHLVACGTSEQQAWIERSLVRARANRDTQLKVEARTFAVRLDVFTRDVLPVLQRARAPGRTDGEPAAVVLAPSADTIDFLEGLEKREGVTAVVAPRLVCWLGQRASVFVGDQVSYIRDFAVHAAEGGQLIADPVIDVLQHGSHLEVATTLLEDGACGLLLAAMVSDVARPITEGATKLPGTTETMRIQLPRQRTVRVRAALALPPRHLALLALPAIDEVRHVIVLRVERIVAPEASPAVGDDRLAWTYDVRDLVAAGAAPGDAEDEPGAPPQLLGLASLVRSFVQPLLRPGDQVTAAGPGHLVLQGLAAQRDWIEAFLTAQGGEIARAWTLRPQVIEMPRDRYEEHVLPLLRRHGLHAGATGTEEAVLPDDPDTARALAGLGGVGGAQVTTLAALTLERFTPTESRDGLHHTKYVRDFEVGQVDGKVTAEPVEDVVRDGPLLTWNLAALADGTVGVALQATIMHLQRPIPTFASKLADVPIRIELPRVTVARGTAALRLPAGHVGVITMPLPDRKQAVIVLRIDAVPGPGR